MGAITIQITTCGLPLECVRLGVVYLKKIHSPSPRCCQLSIVSELGRDLVLTSPSLGFCLDLVCAGLVHAASTTLSLCSAALICSENVVCLYSSVTYGSYIIFLLPQHNDAQVLWHVCVCDTNLLFRDEHSLVCNCLYLRQLWA